MTVLLKKNETEMTQRNDQLVPTQEKNQYNLWQIPTLWLTGSALMWIMGWVIYPALSRNLRVGLAKTRRQQINCWPFCFRSQSLSVAPRLL